jgi:hypothetical protein
MFSFSSASVKLECLHTVQGKGEYGARLNKEDQSFAVIGIDSSTFLAIIDEDYIYLPHRKKKDLEKEERVKDIIRMS